MASRLILFVVEGDRTEQRLIQHILDAFEVSDAREVVPYDTNVHVMLLAMEREGLLEDDTVDVAQFLASQERRVLQNEKIGARERAKHQDRLTALLENEFTDVIMAFDFDPQAPEFNLGRLNRAVDLFSESTDNGKLYVNYPMIESFKDVCPPPDPGFMSRRVTAGDLPGRVYKRIVSERTMQPDYRKYDAKAIARITALNLCKACCLVDADDRSYRAFEQSGGARRLLALQGDCWERESFVYALCTLVFFILSDWPQRLFQALEPSEEYPDISQT